MRQNEPMSSILHFIGAGLSFIGLIIMVVLSIKYGTAWHIVSFVIFGLSMVLLYTASGIYHIFSQTHRGKRLLQKFDKAMIYLLIAGTYTPICLVVLHGFWGWILIGISWLLASAGILFEFILRKTKTWVSLPLYLVMGWLILLAINPLLQSLSLEGVFYLFLGGLFYTLGVIFFVLDLRIPGKRWYSFHDLFHLFVLVGSFFHFYLMIHYVLYIPVY